MNNPVQQLQAEGFRLTKIRRSILDFMAKEGKPLLLSQLRTYLIKNKVPAHRTTIYRELLFLKNQKIIRELQLGENKTRYELMPEDDHHHIICVTCDKIEDVELNDHLRVEEKLIAKNRKFKILMHSLEFYGLCGDCNTS